MREKLIDIVECYADFLDWDTKEDMVDSIMEFLATDNNVGRKWIPVTERLPEKDVLVLCIGSKGGMFIGYPRYVYGDEKVAFTLVPNSRNSRQTKYWMPLPEPPKEERRTT